MMINITDDGMVRMAGWRKYKPFSFDEKDFQWMINNAADNFNSDFGPSSFLGGNHLVIRLLPSDVEVRVGDGYPFCNVHRHGRAPRNMTKGGYFLTQINNRLFIIQIVTGINEGRYRKGYLYRIAVRVPMRRRRQT